MIRNIISSPIKESMTPKTTKSRVVPKVPAVGRAEVVLSEEGLAVCAQAFDTNKAWKVAASPNASEKRITFFIYPIYY